MIGALLRRADRWLFEEYRTSTEDLALFRIIFGVYALVATLPAGLWTLPQAAFSPPVSIAALFTSFPGPGVMLALNAAAMLCASSLIIGLYTAASSLGLACTALLINSFAFADGKIDQGLVIWIASVLAFSGWGSAFSVDARRAGAPSGESAHQAWLLALFALLLGFAMFTAGSAKARGGWLRFDTLGTRYHLFWNYFVTGRTTALATWAWGNLPPWAWKAADFSTVLWEIGFVCSVIRKRACLLMGAIGTLFHVGVWLLFDIKIAANVIGYAAFVSWASLWPGATVALRSWLHRASPNARMLLCATPYAFSVCSLFVLGAALQLQIAMLTTHVVLCVGLLFGVGYLALQARAFATALYLRVIR
jgi:hypothetical protein